MEKLSLDIWGNPEQISVTGDDHQALSVAQPMRLAYTNSVATIRSGEAG
jgi:hypothetical protein